MYEEIIFAGFGGQGVILAGKLACVAAMLEGKNVTHVPSYGPEMRGGTANCSVVISDEEVGSPLVLHPSVCVVLNRPSLDKFESKVRPGGILIWNSTLIDRKPERTDIKCIAIEANKIAEKVATFKVANMVALGHVLKLKPEIASLESCIKALDYAVSSRNKSLNELNSKALTEGFNV